MTRPATDRSEEWSLCPPQMLCQTEDRENFRVRQCVYYSVYVTVCTLLQVDWLSIYCISGIFTVGVDCRESLPCGMAEAEARLITSSSNRIFISIFTLCICSSSRLLNSSVTTLLLSGTVPAALLYCLPLQWVRPGLLSDC